MLAIRLTRKGKKNQPFFRVVVIDKRRSSKGGRAVEVLGYVDPLTKRKNLKKERVLYWISKGAQPSPTMHNLLVSEKIIEGKKINVTKKSKKVPATPATPVEKPVETPAAATAPATPVTTEAPAQNPSDIKAGDSAESKLEEPKPEIPAQPETPPAVEVPAETLKNIDNTSK